MRRQGKLQMEHPEIFTPAAYEEILHSLQPVYGLTAGLSNKTIVKVLHQLLKQQSLKSEYLPEEIREKYQLSDINYALRTIHFPKNMDELLVSRKRLVFDEFLFFILSVQLLKEKTEEAVNLFPIKKTWTTEQVIENLPYRLTSAQLNTWHEIERDLSGQSLMSRLVQGDVGSGKTLVALLSMLLAVDNHCQACMMAPTEILATQHYATVMGFLKDMDIKVALLTGSTKKKERNKILPAIASGEIQLVIGTHALIEETVVFSSLGLAIIDEQHRFGVEQRSRLWTKNAVVPHVLVVAATPGPPSLAID